MRAFTACGNCEVNFRLDTYKSVKRQIRRDIPAATRVRLKRLRCATTPLSGTASHTLAFPSDICFVIRVAAQLVGLARNA